MHADMPVDFDKLLPDAIAAILRLQDAETFFNWMRTNIHHYTGAQPSQHTLFNKGKTFSEESLQALALLFGRMLWNVTPLPRNHFHPEPLPSPGRNDPCPCGSNRKFKHCCLPAYEGAPPLSGEELWPLILHELDEQGRAQAIASKQLPVEMLIELAADHLQEDRPKKALKLIEPLFQPDISGTDIRYDFALNTLCNIYDRLGYNNKKTRLLEHIINHVKRSPLRSGAWQRISAIRMDAGDRKGSWEALQYAQQDTPGNPFLGVLEIQLLLGENRVSEARNRATFWHKQLQKSGEDEDLLDFFHDVAEDPHKALLDLTGQFFNQMDQELPEIIAKGTARPLPDYEIQLFEETSQTTEDVTRNMAAQLKDMGIPAGEIERLINELPNMVDEEEDEDAYEEGAAIITPAAIASLEKAWMEVFSMEKPFSIHNQFSAGIDPWEAASMDHWLGWLEARPEAFDSLSILDDLATAILDHPAGPQPWITEKLLAPILQRSIRILEKALEKTGTEVILEWPVPQNRPALRSLLRMIHVEQSKYNDNAALGYAQRLLQLNPGDNHGIRTLLINQYLKENENDKALQLAAQYPDDMNPEISFGRALALFRLGKTKEANQALAFAMEDLPKVAPMLCRKTVRQPKLSEYGITIGGDDQAWLYREEARELWEKTPGAMEWLKKQRR